MLLLHSGIRKAPENVTNVPSPQAGQQPQPRRPQGSGTPPPHLTIPAEPPHLMHWLPWRKAKPGRRVSPPSPQSGWAARRTRQTPQPPQHGAAEQAGPCPQAGCPWVPPCLEIPLQQARVVQSTALPRSQAQPLQNPFSSGVGAQGLGCRAGQTASTRCALPAFTAGVFSVC